MATGRMVSRVISTDRELADLSDDTSRLLFTWAIPHLDVSGRMHGDPDIFKATVAPRLTHLSMEQIEGYINEWAAKELVVWYTYKGERYLCFPGFDKHQKGLRKDRESPSILPPPPGEDHPKTPDQRPHRVKILDPSDPPTESNEPTNGENPTGSGPVPDQLRQNSSKLPEKGRKEIKGRKEEEESSYSVLVSQGVSGGGGETGLVVATDLEALPLNSWSADGLEASTYKTFLQTNPNVMFRPQKEADSVSQLVARARRASRDGDGSLIVTGMVEAFARLKADDHSPKGFWRTQPFTPSNLISLWDRVWEQAKDVLRAEPLPLSQEESFERKTTH